MGNILKKASEITFVKTLGKTLGIALGKVLQPFQFVMNRLKYAQKFLLIGVLFLIPIGLLLYQLAANLTDQINLSTKEQYGVAYNRSLKELLVQLQEHRELADAVKSGSDNLKDKLTETEKLADEKLDLVEKEEKKHGKLLHTADKLKGIKDQWTSLKGKTATIESDGSFKIHTSLSDQVLKLITYVADQSNLTLDPELDSFYLIELTTNVLPDQTEQISQSLPKGVASLNRKVVSHDDWGLLAIATSDIKRSAENTEKQLGVVFSVNPGLKAALDEPGKNLIATGKNVSYIISDKLLNNPFLTMKPADYADELKKAISANNEYYDTAAKELDRLLQKRLNHLRTNWYIVLSSLIGVLLLVSLFFLSFYRNVNDAVIRLEQSARKMARGDLTVQIELKSRDELSRVGGAFNDLAQSFRSLLQKNKAMAEQVSASAEELDFVAQESVQTTQQTAEAMQLIASSSELQAKSADDNTAALVEVAQGVSRVADSSSKVAEMASHAAEEAKKGQEALNQASRQMDRIRATVDDSAQVVGGLGERSEAIGEIVGVIRGIADQTNLLALNAAIEAARVGEHGRGFAVVADEVRKLAEQSRQSTEKISGLIQEVRNAVAGAIKAMGTGVTEVAGGIEIIQTAEQQFSRILGAVDTVSEHVQDISAASQQMSAGTEEVTASMTEMVSVAKGASVETQNVVATSHLQLASMEEIQAALKELKQMAGELQEEMSKFSL